MKKTQNNSAYFISDVHLSMQLDDQERQKRYNLLLLLDQIKAEQATLFIVGDWFDFYFEYRDVATAAYFDVYAKMRELVDAGVSLHYFGGNHDYWLGSFIADTLGAQIYKQGRLIRLANKHFFLTHGDRIDTTNYSYQWFANTIQSPLFIWFYKWIIPPAVGHWVARKFSKHSRQKFKNETAEYLQQKIRNNYGFAQLQFEQGADFVITGHIHYPQLKFFGEKAFLTIGDFIMNFTYGYFDGVNLSLKEWPVKQLGQRDLP